MTQDIHVPADWFRHFFTAPVNAFWEKMVPPAVTEADMGFIVRHLGMEPPARLLDVPCGAGRHALALARRGYLVEGVDLSADAIVRAAAAAREEELPAVFTRADIRRLPVSGPFDGIVCLGNSVGYFPPDGTLAILHSLAGLLRSGGRLILDTSCCAESILPLKEEREIPFEGGSYYSTSSYDVERSVLSTRAELRLGEEAHSLLYAHQIVTGGELVRMVKAAGFVLTGLYGDTESAPYAMGSPRLLLVAARA